MRMLIALPLLALAACNSGPQSAAEVAEEMQEAPRMRAGLWKTDFTIGEMDVPGAPPEVKQMMQSGMQKAASTYCLSEEEAKRDPKDFLQKNQGSGCTFERFETSGGTVDGKMVCNPQGGARSEAVMKGTIGSERMTMTIDSTTTMPGMESPARISMTMASVRTGDCTGAAK